jgi:hypothetical protein
MKNKSLTQKISLLAISLLSAGSLFGKTLAVDLKKEELDNSFKRPNTFIIRSIQAGSTTDVDNIKVTDLDTNKVVYENSFSNASDATRDLVLHYYPDSGGVESNWNGRNWKDYVENGSMTRIVNGKLRLQTTGFNRNGSGGYNSVSDATYNGELPHNFMVEFDAQRMQWPGHLQMYATYKNPGDTSPNLAPSDNSFKGKLVKLTMHGEGHWYNAPSIQITEQKSPFLFSKPSGDPRRNTRYGMSINGTTVTFYMNGNSIGTANLSDYLKEEKPMNNVDLTSGLVAWYPLDGNASDMSGNGFHGIVKGAISTNDRSGNLNKAYKFDGDDDYIEIPNFNWKERSNCSVSLWSKYDHLPKEIAKDYGMVFGMNSESHCIFLHQDKLFFRQGWGNGWMNAPEKGQWHNFALIWDGSAKRVAFFHNSRKVSEHKAYQNVGLGTGTLRIGANDRLLNYFFNGSIDDVRIYDRALSEEEVLALYELESTNPNNDRPTPPPVPGNGGLTPPDPDYKDTIAELMRLLAEKDKKLAHCEKEMAAKNQEIETLNGEVTGLGKQVTSLETNNKELKGQIQNLREDNQNLNYEITVTNEHLEKAIQVAETPFINGWVYDPERGWLFTDADRFPLIYTHKDQTWHYYELGSSKPRYFFNYKSQEWVAWDAIPVESDQVVANR